MLNQRNLIIAGIITFALAYSLYMMAGGVRGDGNIIEETRDVSNFSQITVNHSGDVYMKQGETFALTIEAEANLMEYLETNVNGDTLTFDVRDNTFLQPTQPINYHLTVPSLSAVRTNASGNITIADSFTAEDFTINVSASGNITLDTLTVTTLNIADNASGEITITTLDAQQIDADLNGSGSVTLAGTTDSQNVSIDGSGSYNGENLTSVTAQVRGNASGDATVRVSDTLDATINGSGNIRYYGNPNVTTRVNGSGDIERMGE